MSVARAAAVVLAALGALVVAAGLGAAFAGGGSTAAQRAALPPLALVDLDGVPVPPDRLAGRVLVLNVWATWCAPCRRELPSLDRLHARLDRTRFTVAGIAAQDDALAVREYLLQRGIGFPTFLAHDRSQALVALGIDRIPATLVVAPDGTLIASFVGPREWDSPDTVSELEALGAATTHGKHVHDRARATPASPSPIAGHGN